jgi:protein SMG6
LRFFGMSFLCKEEILKKVTSSTGQVEFTSIVQNRTETASDSEILLESFSDEEDVKEVKKEANGITNSIGESPDLKSHHDAAEIRKLLRRKDELERKQRMNEKYKERLQVSDPIKICFTTRQTSFYDFECNFYDPGGVKSK